MKNELMITKWIIKNNNKLIVFFILFVYVILLPLCLSVIMNDFTGNVEVTVFGYLQQLVLPLSIILLSYLYSNIVEKEYKEVISTLDRKWKYRKIVIIYIFIQIILTPLYIVICLNTENFIFYLFYLGIQMYTLYNLYYLLVNLLSHSFISLGVMICYMIVYSLMLFDIRIGNIFLINIGYNLIGNNYVIYCLIFSLISIIFATVREKRGL